MRRRAAAIARAVVAFLDAALVGCYLSCFRPRPRPRPGPSFFFCRDALLPVDQEGEEALRHGDHGLGSTGSSCEGSDHGGRIDEEELRREANYLKLCGAISEMPAELQNESCTISLQNADECNNKSTNATATNCTFLSEANSSEGCISEEHYISSPGLNIEDSPDLPGVESAPHAAFLEKTPFLNSKHKALDHSVSPFPTPLVLKDDMQTPGTIHTSHRGALVSGKRVRTSKQFIYPVLRPIDNNLHMDLIADTSAFPLPNSLKARKLGADSAKKSKQISSTSVAKPGSSFSSYKENEAQSRCQIDNVVPPDEEALLKSNLDEKHAAVSLSNPLRPSSTDNDYQVDTKCAVGDQLYDEGQLLTDIPVFMASSLNCDVENLTPTLPKAWDGNGIPNTNRRYKEDKKVTWHATPFEERLLKVLSDEEIRPVRLARGKLFDSEGKAE